ncbi:hypothetical protein RLOatenuis_3910 [Rickettsiales bacterium]|nr:hypothetical protein RLOatenuis_3910 [Rickettsiales bacterium]
MAPPNHPPKTNEVKGQQSKVGGDSEPGEQPVKLPFSAEELQKAKKTLKHVEIIKQKEERPNQDTERAEGFRPKIAPKPRYLKRNSPPEKRGEQVQESDPFNILDIKPTVFRSVAYLSPIVDLEGAQAKYTNKRKEKNDSAKLLKKKKEELRGTRWFKIFKRIKLSIEIRQRKKEYEAAKNASSSAARELQCALGNTADAQDFIPIKLDELEKFLEQDNEIAQEISNFCAERDLKIETFVPNERSIQTAHQNIKCLDIKAILYHVLLEDTAATTDSKRMRCIRIVEKCIEEIEKCPTFDREEHEPIYFQKEEIKRLRGNVLNLQELKSLVGDFKQSLEEKMERELKEEHKKDKVQGQEDSKTPPKTESRSASLGR